MILLVVLAAAVVLALLRGGSLTRLGSLQIRWSGLILTGFLIQVLIFTEFWQKQELLRELARTGYLASMLLLGAALVRNRRIPGMWLITLGYLSNLVVIALNGGYMPASPDAIARAGLAPLGPGQVSNNSIGAGPNTRLLFLADVFAIPSQLPFSNVFSVGDVLIAGGAVYLISRAMAAPAAVPVASSDIDR